MEVVMNEEEFKKDEVPKNDEEPAKNEDIFVPRRSKRQRTQTDFYGYGKKK